MGKVVKLLCRIEFIYYYFSKQDYNNGTTKYLKPSNILNAAQHIFFSHIFISTKTTDTHNTRAIHNNTTKESENYL